MIQDLRASFDEHADSNAFCIKDTYFTYRQFNELIGRIRLEMAGVGGSRTKRVGISTTDSIETYASIFACWYSGCAYVPIHPKNPEERSRTIIREAGIDLILGAGAEMRDFAGYGMDFRVVATDSLPAAASAAARRPEDPVAKDGGIVAEDEGLVPEDGDLLYILFTSGSTGVPKGVPITYENVKVFVDSYLALGFECDASDRFLQMFDLTFDVSVASYLIPLLLGACVYTVPAEGIKYMNVYKLLQRHQITFASIVPSIINYLKPYFDEIRLPHLKYCILTAEASNLKIVIDWLPCMPGGQIFNLYGPTEATIWCTGYHFDAANPKAYNEMLIIGRPFKHVGIMILDENGNETPWGQKGELCVSGGQITRGYLNNEEKNITAFILKEGKRFYRTGDLCYLDEDGDLYYCGRADHQVKIQGFRIELSEIEVVARELFLLNTTAVVYRNTLGIQQIGLFLEKYTGELDSVKSTLEQKLPYYMIPSAIQAIDTLPYNNSGKVDRVSLVKRFEE
jgi:D-alanine--poly(phosphoribitol) ligase subunit 1